MGVGKTSVGRRLAELLERPFYDTDDYVEATSGRTVDSFFPDDEPDFRRREAAAVRELVDRGPSVIALGGGALLSETSRRLLLERTVLVHLYVPWAELKPSLGPLLATRPLLRGRSLAEIETLYEARSAVYGQAAIRVTVGRSGVDTAANAVLRQLT